MYTPERGRACDAREPVTYGECVREARAELRDSSVPASRRERFFLLLARWLVIDF